MRQHLVEVSRKLAKQNEGWIEEAHLLLDHAYMMISILLKYAVAQMIGFTQGKSVIHLARVNGERKQNFASQSFWVRGYFVSTVGRDEAVQVNCIVLDLTSQYNCWHWREWRGQ